MERTIDDLFGPSFSAASTSSFMKPPSKKLPVNQEKDKENSERTHETLKPENTENVKPQVPFIMKPPTKKEPSLLLAQEMPIPSSSEVLVSHKKSLPKLNFEKLSISSMSATSAPVTESNSGVSAVSPLEPTFSSAPAFVVKSFQSMSCTYQISLKDWFFVSIEGSLCAIGKRVEIEEMWKSEEVMIRIDPRTFITNSQVQYQLIGPAKPPSQLQSQHQPFCEGLPALWKQLIK